jgi:hypothetical protein
MHDFFVEPLSIVSKIPQLPAHLYENCAFSGQGAINDLSFWGHKSRPNLFHVNMLEATKKVGADLSLLNKKVLNDCGNTTHELYPLFRMPTFPY